MDEHSAAYHGRYEGFVEEQVESGRYESASAVIDAGLELLQREQKEFARVKGLIDEGLAALERGDYTVYENADDLYADIMRDVDE